MQISVYLYAKSTFSQIFMAVELEPSWLQVLGDEFDKDYMLKLRQFLKDEKLAGKTIYPKGSDIFNAFWKTPFTDLEVVILGQDPYHGAHQAHGLSFSVQKGIAIPRSLSNIYKELKTDIPGFETPVHGNLQEWAQQGVLLLNATLTVRASEPGSHQKHGWEIFTDTVISKISELKTGIVFILWGSYAQAKAELIDKKKHHIIKSPHPSPFSADRGFFGSRPFSKTNEILIKEGKKPIDWQVTK
jgi:uracil-DNA glycosylase